MTRIENCFSDKEKKLITFITACDPDYDTSLEVLKALPKAGADIIELGMPFTDPMADGPAIQAANIRALKGGASMKRTLSMVRKFREENEKTPLVLMGYANPVYAYGLEAFAEMASKAGVDGLIIVDLPPEEDNDLRSLASSWNIDLIRLLTPTSDESRLPRLLKGVDGFLYYVSVAGVTGTGSADMGSIKPHLETIKKQSGLPVAVGFGIKTPQDAKAMAETADGIVVGSAIVEKLHKEGIKPALKLVSELAQAIRS